MDETLREIVRLSYLAGLCRAARVAGDKLAEELCSELRSVYEELIRAKYGVQPELSSYLDVIAEPGAESNYIVERAKEVLKALAGGGG